MAPRECGVPDPESGPCPREWVVSLRLGRVPESGGTDSKGMWSKKFLPRKNIAQLFSLKDKYLKVTNGDNSVNVTKG